MKRIFAFTLLFQLVLLTAQAQKVQVKKCVTCGKPIASCQFKGKHPKPNPTPGGKVSTKQTSGNINGHDWVDLGLSVKWATCNVGASSPSDYGDYFAQGEIHSKTIYNGTTYTPPYDSNVGFIERFDASHDAATVNWGAPWRMPTDAENKELCTKCKWTWTAINGHNGYRITGPSGKSIFMPASGFRGEDFRRDDGEVGYYWSSLWGWSSKKNNYGGRTLKFDNDSYSTDNARSWAGINIRPVTK